jgi:cellulose binding protein with CBM2 domain
VSRFHVPRGRARPAAFAVLTAIASSVTLALATVPASAITVSGTPSPVTGNATWFTALGSPYGGCGLPQDQLDSQNFLALNVQNSPGNYSNLPRPIPAADASEIGMWDNGLNCGRWVQVTVSDFCNGTNDGAPNMAFCRNGSYVPDQFNGATLNFIVGDSCDDGNAWCKDDPFHIDLAQASLNNFMLNGQPVGNMFPDHWNNRHVTWQFIPAPNYTGDIKIGAIQGAQPFWPAIAVSHLANGIHSVQFFANGSWVNAQMDADMGDDYIIGPTTGAGTGGSQFEIRVTDSNDQLINNGRVYSFSLPSSCANGCGPAYTPITYTTSAGPSPTPTPTTSSPPPSTTPPAGGGSCKLTSSVATSWQGGFQLNLTVANTGSTASTGWSAGFSFGDSAESVANFWNSTVTQSGTQVSATNVGFNGAIPAGGSTTFGMIVNGNTQGLSGLTCSLR